MNKELQKIINESNNIVLFTGAGISCPSGIPDFRSADGLYNTKNSGKYSPEEIISHDCLMEEPEVFFDYYFKNMVFPWAKPNYAHLYFAELEKKGKLKAVVTQNIDGLHSMAGNKNVYELHGSVYRNYCVACGKGWDPYGNNVNKKGRLYGLEYVLKETGIPKCAQCSKMVRPDVVLYGEALDMNVWTGAENAVRNADCLIVVGTSLTVYPAAGLLDSFKGKYLVIINKQRTPYDKIADLVLHEDVIDVLR